MMKNVGKLFQRSFYSFVSSWLGFCIVFIFCAVILNSFIQSVTLPCVVRNSRLRGDTGTIYCSNNNYVDNIGHIHLEEYITAYGPIDVVYTWVNGSDPIWKAKKDKWSEKLHGPTNHTILNETDDTKASNRYRDSNELRYSLRSLEKYGPWIRNVFLVTDNQLPNWLNIESPHIKVVTHKEIFPNRSHLPVFSSPAIESHIHLIPGLSKKFIYFNDDVFLGANTYPEDFMTVTGVQKLYMAWDVPKCSPGCSDSWIGDGYCDKACNVSACNWDYPDCTENATRARASKNKHSSSNTDPNVYQRTQTTYCKKGCPDNWLADKVCDVKCKVPECGYDAGDCGISMVTDAFRGALLTSANCDLSVEMKGKEENSTTTNTTAISNEMKTPVVVENATTPEMFTNNTEQPSNTSDAVAALPPVVLTVPYGTQAVHFNVSQLLYYTGCPGMPLPSTSPVDDDQADLSDSLIYCNISTVMAAFSYTAADYEDGPVPSTVIHSASLLTKHNTLVVLLYRPGQDDAPKPALDLFPVTVPFKVTAQNTDTNLSVSLSFMLRIDRDPSPVTQQEQAAADRRAGVPIGMSALSHGYTSFSTSAAARYDSSDALPFTPADDVDALFEAVTLRKAPFSWEHTPNVLQHPSEQVSEGVVVDLVLHKLPLAHKKADSIQSDGTAKDSVRSASMNSVYDFHMKHFYARQMITLLNGTEYDILVDFCSTLTGSFVSQDISRTRRAAKGNETDGVIPVFAPLPFSNIFECQQMTLLDVIRSFQSGADGGRVEAEMDVQEDPSHNHSMHRLNTQIPVSTRLRGTDLRYHVKRTGKNAKEKDHVDVLHSVLFMPLPWKDTINSTWIHSKTELLFVVNEDDVELLQDVSADSERLGGVLRDVSDVMDLSVSDASHGRHDNHTTVSVGNFLSHHSVPLSCWITSYTWGGFYLHNVHNASAALNTTDEHSAHDSSSVSDSNTTLSNSNDVSMGITASTNASSSLQTVVPPSESALEDIDILNLALQTRRSLSVSNGGVVPGRQRKYGSLTRTIRLVGEAPGDITSTQSARISSVGMLTHKRRLVSTLTPVSTHTKEESMKGRVVLPGQLFDIDQFPHHSVNVLISWKNYMVQFMCSALDIFGEVLSEHIDKIDGGAGSSSGTRAMEQKHRMPKRRNRRLMDTYGSSLIHVNRLYSKEFGTENRKVPAHMPHLIDRDVVSEMQEKWTKEWDDTSAHRFRSPTDMQYAFAYYYYVINKHKAKAPSISSFLENEIDTNRDGVIDDNEMRTLALLIQNKPMTEVSDLDTVWNCTNASSQHQDTSYATTKGVHNGLSTFRSFPTIKELANCSFVVKGLTEKSPWPATHSMGSEKEIAFEMVGDNYTTSLHQLDSIRGRKVKFICLNDNMQTPSVKLQHELKLFFTALYPKPSQFEHPEGFMNPTLYVDEYVEHYASWSYLYRAYSAQLQRVWRHWLRQATVHLLQLTESLAAHMRSSLTHTSSNSYVDTMNRRRRLQAASDLLDISSLVSNPIILVAVGVCIVAIGLVFRMTIKRKKEKNDSDSDNHSGEGDGSEFDARGLTNRKRKNIATIDSAMISSPAQSAGGDILNDLWSKQGYHGCAQPLAPNDSVRSLSPQPGADIDAANPSGNSSASTLDQPAPVPHTDSSSTADKPVDVSTSTSSSVEPTTSTVTDPAAPVLKSCLKKTNPLVPRGDLSSELSSPSSESKKLVSFDKTLRDDVKEPIMNLFRGILRLKPKKYGPIERPSGSVPVESES